MSHENRQRNNDKSLEQDLKRLYQAPGQIPAGMDQAILKMAKGQLAPQRPIRLYRVLSAAAAVLVIGISLIFLTPLLEPKPLLAGDMDQNGIINILDALHLARQLPAHTQSNPQWDFNSDGSVDQTDVDHIAYRAVRLATRPAYGHSQKFVSRPFVARTQDAKPQRKAFYVRNTGSHGETFLSYYRPAIQELL